MISKKGTQSTKNREKRLQVMKAGLADLEIWLSDLVRQGLAETEGQAYSYWQNISARMVDAYLGGLGKRIKALPLLQGADIQWPSRMLSELAQFYLVVKGFDRLEALPEPLQAELLSVAGIHTRKTDLMPFKGVSDEWVVIGEMTGVEDNLNFRRSWLYGLDAEKIALILEYTFGEAEFQEPLFVGKRMKAELVYYPSGFPLRAILKEITGPAQRTAFPQGFSSLHAFFNHYASVMAASPWIYHFPAFLEGVIPVIKAEKLMLVDGNKNVMEVLHKGNSGWKLIAVSGGRPVAVFGEWTGELLIPLCAIAGGRLIKL